MPAKPSSSVRVALKLTAAVAIGAAGVLFLRSNEITIHTAVSPAIPGTYKHASAVCELTDGNILLVYYSGSAEYGSDTALYATVLDRQRNLWTRPRIIADATGEAEGNPVLWTAPDGRIWLFYPIREGETWSTARLAAKVSSDEGHTWIEAPPPSDRRGLMTRARPFTLADGGCLLPVDFNPSTDTEFVSVDSGSMFLRSDPLMEQWTATGIIHSRLGNLQPTVANVDDDQLVAYCRRGGDYAGRADGMLVRSESSDHGLTWSEGQETDFPNPNSPVDFVRLQSGNLLLAYNNSSFSRNPLSVALSTDGDRTYPHRRDIISGDMSYSYPSLLQCTDGTIFLFFTAGARSHVCYAVLQEDALLRH